MLLRLLPIVRKSAAAISLLWSPRTLITQFSAPIPSLPLLTHLNLTVLQQQKLQPLCLNIKAQLNEALSLEQKQAFLSTLIQSRIFLIALEAMQLSVAQEQNLVAILLTFSQQIVTILTLNQQQYWDQLIQDRIHTQLLWHSRIDKSELKEKL